MFERETFVISVNDLDTNKVFQDINNGYALRKKSYDKLLLDDYLDLINVNIAYDLMNCEVNVAAKEKKLIKKIIKKVLVKLVRIYVDSIMLLQKYLNFEVLSALKDFKKELVSTKKELQSFKEENALLNERLKKLEEFVKIENNSSIA